LNQKMSLTYLNACVIADTRKSPKRNGQDAIQLPDDLPIEKQVIDLPEQQKICPETGAQLVKIGEEVTQKIAHKPGSYYIKEIIRYKYALPQGAGILTPPLPEALLERCQAVITYPSIDKQKC